MNTNNTLLTLTTVAMVFTGAADAANAEVLHNNPVTINQVQELDKVQAFATNNLKCTPGDTRPECRPNEDCVCLAA